MMRFARLLGALVLISHAGHVAAAPEPRAVVELFTSQGCSSCPPADKLLGELARRPDILALSLPVDYWDYLGWKDTLAQPAFTARQRAYASARGDKQIYTPQMVINGSTPLIGSDRAKVEETVGRRGSERAPLPVQVALSETGSTVRVEIGPANGPVSAGVWILPVARAREVAIGRGENQGRSIAYANVVRGMMKLGDWSGQPLHFDVPLAVARTGDADSYVVLLQAANGSQPGPILGAAKGPGL